MKDVAIIPLSNELELVIASDNSAAIGRKKLDAVQVDHSVTGYYATRVAYMDLLRVGARPKAIVLQNFTGDEAWEAYEKGVRQLLAETEYADLPITGSTESNFTTLQSALGLTIVGTREKPVTKQKEINENTQFAVIGKPLVGHEALEQSEHIAPLFLFEQLSKCKAVIDLVPVGSTGIQAEWQQLTGKRNKLASDLNVSQSGGPATCFIIAYDSQAQEEIENLAGTYFHPIQLME